MGLPAKRRTKQSKRERASHFALKASALIACSHCKRMIRSHRVCPHCGYYQGRAVVNIPLRSERQKSKKRASTDTPSKTDS